MMALCIIVILKQLKYASCPFWVEWINKLVYLFREILARNKNDQTNTTHRNTDEFLKYGTDQKKPGNSLVVQWLDSMLSLPRAWVQTWLGNYDPKSHTAHSKSKQTNKQTKHILYGSIYMFPPTYTYMSFEIRCNESRVAKLALCLPLERVPGRNTGGLLGVVIASHKWKCYPSLRWTSSVWLGACWWDMSSSLNTGRLWL